MNFIITSMWYVASGRLNRGSNAMSSKRKHYLLIPRLFASRAEGWCIVLVCSWFPDGCPIRLQLQRWLIVGEKELKYVTEPF